MFVVECSCHTNYIFGKELVLLLEHPGKQLVLEQPISKDDILGHSID